MKRRGLATDVRSPVICYRPEVALRAPRCDDGNMDATVHWNTIESILPTLPYILQNRTLENGADYYNLPVNHFLLERPYFQLSRQSGYSNTENLKQATPTMVNSETWIYTVLLLTDFPCRLIYSPPYPVNIVVCVMTKGRSRRKCRMLRPHAVSSVKSDYWLNFLSRIPTPGLEPPL